MIEFLKDSETFNSIVFSGNYDMPLDHFEKIYKHYQETGENLLDDYSFVVYKTWERNDENIMLPHEEFNDAFKKISKLRSLRFGDFEIVYEAMHVCRQQLKRYQNWKEKNSTKYRKRVAANKFIADEDIRSQLFEMYGEKCLCCGSTDNLQIDHIQAVYNGGENDIDNLQPLCKSCNVSKGTKTIDYRDNE